MQPNYISIADVFGKQARYTVPLFQRPYVWSRAEQWEPLWEDVQALLQRVLTHEGEKAVAGHFLGTVVLENVHTDIIHLPRREIIDGQQRLTTLQILLKAAEHALFNLAKATPDAEAATAIQIAGSQIALLTNNPATSTAEEAFKVWPTNEDRAPFMAVMESSARVGATGQATRMSEAYAYFRDTFRQWLTGANLASRAQALAAGLRHHLRLIVLDLDETDEPQAIFETLNAHGTPLLPADLIKNWLLWEAARQKLSVPILYEGYWRPFDKEAEYWRTKIGVGHAARPRIDNFFQNWLAKETREFVSPKHIYDRFLRYMASGAPRQADGVSPDVLSVLASLRDDAVRYRDIQAPTGSTRFAAFLRRLERLDVLVFTPVIMALMARTGSDADDLDAIAIAFESYLVRRMVCNQQTRGYGGLALNLLDILAGVPAEQTAASVMTKSLRFAAPSPLVWPDDAMFQHDWTSRRFYNGLRRDRVLMILQALEEHLHLTKTKGEPVKSFDFSKLQIEHVLPQTWQTHWELEGATTHAEREHALHGIGNLTLVSNKLNPSLSNAPWLAKSGSKVCKRDALNEHTFLELNAQLVRQNPGGWNESGMLARATWLFEAARRIWPDAATLMSAQQVRA